MKKHAPLLFGSLLVLACAFLSVQAGVIPAIIPAAVPTANKTGNGSMFATATAAGTSGNCAQWDASGNVGDSGGACGAGSGNVTAAGTLTTGDVVIGQGTKAVAVTGVGIDGSNNITTPGSVTTGNGSSTTGILTLKGKTSGNAVTFTVADATAAGTLTFPGITATVPGISGTPTTGNCANWASATTLGDAGSACGSGGGANVPFTGWTVVNGALLSNFAGASYVGMDAIDNGSTNWRFVTRTITVPYTLIATFDCHMTVAANTSACGMTISDGTKFENIDVLDSSTTVNQLSIRALTNVTTQSSVPAGPTSGLVGQRLFTLKIVNDSTHRTFFYYSNGAFTQFFQEATGTFLTETSAGFGGVSVTGNAVNFVGINLVYWSVT